MIEIKSLFLHSKKKSKIEITMDTSRIKVILAEQTQTNKCLAEQFGKYPAMVSKWSYQRFKTEPENIVADCRTC